MINEFKNWTKSLGKNGKLVIERNTKLLNLYTSYCKGQGYDACEDAKKAYQELNGHIEYYKKNRKNLSAVIERFFNKYYGESLEAPNGMSYDDCLIAFIYSEKEQITFKEANVLADKLDTYIHLYLNGVEDLIELNEKIDESGKEFDDFSDAVLSNIGLKVNGATEKTREVATNIFNVTKESAKEMAPIIKQGFEDSKPVAKNYVKNLSKTIKGK